MSCKVVTILPFERQLKRLAKKYPSLKKEYITLLDDLEENPNQGTGIGKNCSKIRISIKSKGKGKRGGGRVVTTFVVEENALYLLSIYDKSEKDNLSDAELSELLKLI